MGGADIQSSYNFLLIGMMLQGYWNSCGVGLTVKHQF